MTRLPDWRVRLTAYVASVRNTPLQPGVFDCAEFAAGVIEAVTGQVIGHPARGAYGSLQDGRRLLRDHGQRSIKALASAYLQPVDAAFAREGDIGILAGSDGRDAFGVIIGGGILALSDQGLRLCGRGEMKSAFKVG